MKVKECYNIPEDQVRIIDQMIQDIDNATNYYDSFTILEEPLDIAVMLLNTTFNEYKRISIEFQNEFNLEELVTRKDNLALLAIHTKALNKILSDRIAIRIQVLENIKDLSCTE